MKVKELQALLSKLDQSLEIICYTEDSVMKTQGQDFYILDIESVDVTEAEKVRLDNNTPYLKFGKSDNSKKMAILNIISEF